MEPRNQPCDKRDVRKTRNDIYYVAKKRFQIINNGRSYKFIPNPDWAYKYIQAFIKKKFNYNNLKKEEREYKPLL